MDPTGNPETTSIFNYPTNRCPLGSAWNDALNRCQSFSYNEHENSIPKEDALCLYMSDEERHCPEGYKLLPDGKGCRKNVFD